jgi:SAM-dependent methyltransferase
MQKVINAQYIFHILLRFLMNIRRKIYQARILIPGMREYHRLESMVGPLGYWKKLQLYQLNVLVTNGLKPHHSLMDIGCGPLQGGIALINYLDNGKYVGIDKNSEGLSAGYSQIVKYGLSEKNPLLILSNIFGKDEIGDKKFDFFWASQVLYYFDDGKMKELFEFLSFHLNPGGKLTGDIMGEKHYAFRYPQKRNKYVLHTIDYVKKTAELYGLKVRSLGEIVDHGYPKRLNSNTNILVEITRI